MSLITIATLLPLLRSRAASSRGAAPEELAALQDRVIADLGLLWCDLAYHERGCSRGQDDAINSAMSPPLRRARSF